MDIEPLRQFEQAAARAAADAFDHEDYRGSDPIWGSAHGTIYEQIGNVADQLARVARSFPGDAHYVRDKARALLGRAIALHDRVLEPAFCAVEVPDGVYDDGTVNAYDCGRLHGHAGEHIENPPARQAGDAAGAALDAASTLAGRTRWALLHSETLGDDTIEDITADVDAVRARLDDLITHLPRLRR